MPPLCSHGLQFHVLQDEITDKTQGCTRFHRISKTKITFFPVLEVCFDINPWISTKEKVATMHRYPFHRSKHHNELHRTESHITDDGRISISFPSHLFQGHEHRSSTDLDEQDNLKFCKQRRSPFHQRKEDFRPVVEDSKAVPRMNVAILITGSRGDVQPFIALGQTLQKPPYCHRVRICTHPVFKDFVLENGLEFYSIGGDPSKLLLYMTRNPGVIPSFESIKAGDVGARKADIDEMMEGAWKACTSSGDGMTTIDLDAHSLDEDVLISYPAPFVADAIIANPPTYAHIHIAEKLAIPCHLMFTMPWSPTRAFPHPLTNVDASKVENAAFANFLSYKKMELLTWEGLSDVINHFREKTLGLDAISPLWGHRLITRLRVPFTYCIRYLTLNRCLELMLFQVGQKLLYRSLLTGGQI